MNHKPRGVYGPHLVTDLGWWYGSAVRGRRDANQHPVLQDFSHEKFSHLRMILRDSVPRQTAQVRRLVALGIRKGLQP